MKFPRYYKSQHRNKPNEDVSFWNKLGMVANIIAAITTAIALYQAKSFHEQNLLMSKPRFVLYHPHFYETANSDHFEFVVTLIITGTRPAHRTSVLVIGTKPTISSKPYKTYRAEISNELSPPDQPTIRVPVGKFTENEPIQHFFVGLKFYDPILNVEMEQKFYLTWPGIKDRSASEVLNHMSIDEQRIFIEKFKAFLIE